MTWMFAARLFPRKGDPDRIKERSRAAHARRQPLHVPRTVATERVVERVLALRVLLHQHCQGETPFAAPDIEALCEALEVFVQRYELAPRAIAPAPIPTPPVEDIEPLVVEEQPKPAAPTRVLPRSSPAPPSSIRVREVAPAASVRVTLKAVEAAERFVEWVRLSGKTGTYASEEFSELYRSHCDAEDLIVLSDNVLRPALRRIPGVTQLTSDTGRKRRDRVRRSLWRIDADPSATVDVPWDELPRRSVA